ncbi:MAG: hypothetical protein ACHRHE_02220 [Tepidisphaerales bacterium]
MLSTPGRLAEYLPDSWQDMIAKGGLTVAFLISGVAGCSESGQVPTATPTTRAAASAASQPTTRTAMLASAAAIVAPIFEHGEGMAVTGCVVIAPPVFLTEEEGRQIIIEELRKAGVSLSAHDVQVNDIRMKRLTTLVSERDGKIEWSEGEVEVSCPLVIDLVDPDRHVAAQYISKGDCRFFNDSTFASTVQRFNFKDNAGRLADAIKRDGKGHFVGVFYDPGNRAWPEKAARNGAETVSREQLRQQVRDFAEWLRQRGVI